MRVIPLLGRSGKKLSLRPLPRQAGSGPGDRCGTSRTRLGSPEPDPAPNRHRAPATRFCRSVLALLVLAASCSDEEPIVIVAHRGATLLALENTIAAFEGARDQGADGVELDVQLTADDRVVVLHDLQLDRTTVCTGSVRERTLAELADCPLTNGEPLRTLDAVLDRIGPWFDLIFVEVKVDEPTAQELRADLTAAIVLASGYADRVVVISYDETVLRRLTTWRSEGVVSGWDDHSNDAISYAARFDMDWALMPLYGLDPWDGRIVTGLDKRLCVYGILTPAHYVAARRAGVSVIMTDSITTILALAGRKPPGTSADAAAIR